MIEELVYILLIVRLEIEHWNQITELGNIYRRKLFYHDFM